MPKRARPLLAGLLTLLAACVPAAVPQHLDDTPGPPVIVAGRRLEASTFALEAPPGWRIITSPASAEPFVILAGGDGCSLIAVYSSPPADALPNPCPDREARTVHRQSADPPAWLTGLAPSETWPDFVPLFEAVLASLDAPTASP